MLQTINRVTPRRRGFEFFLLSSKKKIFPFDIVVYFRSTQTTMSSILEEIEEGIDVSRISEEPTSQRLQPNDPAAPQENGEEDILGLDKPIKLRTRAKIARMDNARIFSPNGLPYIVKNHGKLIRTIQKNDKKFYSNPRNSISKTQKFEHEFDNLSSVLQFYQLWCHGLFPKANFKDCIHLVRSLNGKSAQLRLYRRELINAELHKLKVAKGIIVEDANNPEDQEQQQQADADDNDDWGIMHTQAITADDNNTNGPTQNTGSGLESLFVDSNSTEDLTPLSEPSLFVDLNSTEDLTPRQDIESAANNTSTTIEAPLKPLASNNDNESDDPFSDDDMSMLQVEPSSIDMNNVQEDELMEGGQEDDDLELELMRQNDP